MLNFFTIVLIVFIVLLILILRKRKLKSTINIKNLYPNKFKIDRKNNMQFLSNSYSYIYEETKHTTFYKNSQRNKMFTLFQGDKEDKLKALKIAEELADKSTLPILRKGLRDISPEVIEFSALLIRKFK